MGSRAQDGKESYALGRLGDTEYLVAAGARLLRRRDDEIGWDVLADPEGNEFCVFTRHEI